MLAGLQVLRRILPEGKGGKRRVIAAGEYTASGLLTRTGAMLLVNYFLLPYPPPVGFSLPYEVVVLYMPLIAFFNATLALYTIFGGCILASIVAPAAVQVKRAP